MEIVTDLLSIVFASIIGGFVAHFLRQPLVLGYIFAGVIVGPHTGGVTLERVHDIEKLAEIGVALLLFTLGLEFSFGELKRFARITIFGTPVQITICALAAYGSSRLLGLSWSDSVWIGAATSLSSTMVVLKTLAANQSTDSDSGRIMLTILIAQDLALVPLMLILPELTSAQIDYTSIIMALFKSVLFLVFMFIAGTKIFPRIFSIIARAGSRELFFLVTLGVALGSGFLTYYLGLSFALGAFVAGMLLSDTEFNHQALSDISSLRDLFGLIFFVSVGMLFDPHFLISHLTTVLLLLVLIVFSKALILAGVVRLFGFNMRKAWKIGFGLSQVGEFAFVIGNTGSYAGALSADSYSLLISTAVVSMVITPGLFAIGNWCSRHLASANVVPREMRHPEKLNIEHHVIIIGGGVVGQYVAGVLHSLNSPYVIIENDYKNVAQMRDRGLRAMFGDGSRRVILEGAQIEHARLVVIATTNDMLLPLVLGEISSLNKSVPVVTRVEEIEDLAFLSITEVHEIVQPQLEAALEMVRQSLLALGIGELEILALLGKLRAQRYKGKVPNPSLQARDLVRLKATRQLDFGWLEVDRLMIGSDSDGDTLMSLKLREKYGISVVAVIRGEDVSPSPGPQFHVMSGDLVGVLGTQAQLELIRKNMVDSL